MKFSCTQENLNRGLQLVAHIATRNINLPILQNILIEADNGTIMLSATNLEIGVRVKIRGKVEEAGTFSLPGQLLMNYVNLLPDERVDCHLIGKEFSITVGDQKTIIKGEVASEYPILPTIKKDNPYTLVKKDFELSLQQTIIAASLDETRPEIAGIFYKCDATTLTLAATDSYRLAEKKVIFSQSSGDVSSIIPQRSNQELLRIMQLVSTEAVSLYFSDNQVGCDIGEVEFVSRVIEGNFPQYQDVIPTQGNATVSLEIKQWIKAIKSVALFSKSGINDIQLDFSPSKQLLTISAINAQLGENTTNLPIKGSGQDVTIVFNYRYLLDGLQQLPGTTVECLLIDSISPAVFSSDQDETYCYIIMPIKQ